MFYILVRKTLNEKLSFSAGFFRIHFYGELVKTNAGCDYLRQSKHLEIFRKDILSTETSLT